MTDRVLEAEIDSMVLRHNILKWAKSLFEYQVNVYCI